MYTTLKIISRKSLGVSLIWTFFSHVGAIFLNSPYSKHTKINELYMSLMTKVKKTSLFDVNDINS
jgi:hypothetical protein